MYFYAMFAVGLAFRRPLAITLSIGAIVVMIGQLGVGDANNAIFVAYTSPIVTEFFQGMLIALVHRRRSLAPFWAALPLGVGALILVGNLDAPRLLIWGLPSALILIGCLALEDAKKMPSIALVKLLGDASYSIYLSHAFVLQMGLLLWWQVPVTGWAQFVIFTPTAVVGCSLVGILIYRYVERPMLKRVQLRPQRATG